MKDYCSIGIDDDENEREHTPWAIWGQVRPTPHYPQAVGDT